MAATISTNHEPKFQRAYLISPDPDQDIWELTGKRDTFLEEKKFEAILADPMSAGRGGDLGHRIPEEFYPKRLQFEKGKKLFGYNENGALPFVNQVFKDCVEAIEPDAHQFIPIEQILLKDGTPYEDPNGPFYFFNVITVLDAINPDPGGVKPHTAAPIDKDKPQYWTPASGMMDRLEVYKNRIEGVAAWRDSRNPGMPFYSDALLSKLSEYRVEGFRVQYTWSEV
jgi:hypothetical protein